MKWHSVARCRTEVDGLQIEPRVKQVEDGRRARENQHAVGY